MRNIIPANTIGISYVQCTYIHIWYNFSTSVSLMPMWPHQIIYQLTAGCIILWLVVTCSTTHICNMDNMVLSNFVFSASNDNIKQSMCAPPSEKFIFTIHSPCLQFNSIHHSRAEMREIQRECERSKKKKTFHSIRLKSVDRPNENYCHIHQTHINVTVTIICSVLFD